MRRPPVPERPPFPNWGVTVIATGAMIVILILGVAFSQHLAGPQAGAAPVPAAGGSDTGNTTSANVAPVAVPAHQTYNPQAPTALQGKTVNVTLTVATPGASILYTTDGTDPDSVVGGATKQYAGTAIPITATTTLKARGVMDGMGASAVMTEVYTKVEPGKVATPTANPAGRNFTGTLSVTLTSATAGAAVYYTTDGTAPTASTPPPDSTEDVWSSLPTAAPPREAPAFATPPSSTRPVPETPPPAPVAAPRTAPPAEDNVDALLDHPADSATTQAVRPSSGDSAPGKKLPPQKKDLSKWDPDALN